MTYIYFIYFSLDKIKAIFSLSKFCLSTLFPTLDILLTFVFLNPSIKLLWISWKILELTNYSLTWYFIVYLFSYFLYNPFLLFESIDHLDKYKIYSFLKKFKVGVEFQTIKTKFINFFFFKIINKLLYNLKSPFYQGKSENRVFD